MGTNKSLQLGLAGVVRDVQGVPFGKFHKYDTPAILFFMKHTVLAVCRNHYAYSVHLDD